MIRNRIIWILPVLIFRGFLFSSSFIIAQKPGPDSLILKSDLYREKFHLFTDRNIYAAGEKIFFRAYNLTDPELKEGSWSTVLYMELLDATNKSFANGKYHLEKWGASGYIGVPANLPAGNFYIRAYTKWMRNFSPYEYAYSRITLINPYSEETNDILSPEVNKYTIPHLKTGEIMVIKDIVKCSTSQGSYKKREKVILQIKIPEKDWISPDGYCVSVIKSGAINSNIYGLNFSDFKEYEIPSEVKFYPELKGISLSGSIIKKDMIIPSAYSEVHLSALGDNPYYIGYLTEQQGRFLFSLPDWHESRNFYIAVETKDEDPVEILIDNDFSTDLVSLPGIPFTFSGEEKNIAREIMFNMQLDNAYTHARDLSADSTMINPQYKFFYGNPTITLKTSDYVKLPTLEEFFHELIPSVSVIKRKDRSEIVMKGNNPDIAFFKPLLLLDFVPVFNADNLLKISPEYIRQIEVINSTYIRGNMCFGGIISVLSHKGDMAGIDLPENSIFFDFKTYEPQDEIIFPDYSDSQANKRIPDSRNTMYWNPALQGSPGETISCEFFTSDNTGEYIILVRGISEQGSILEGHCNFTVE